MKRLFILPILLLSMLVVTPAYSVSDFQLGVSAYQKGDYETAVKWFTFGAERGDIPAQHTLASMYLEGLGIPQNYEAAVKWYTLAAEQGAAPAQYSLAVMYHEGKGVPQDNETAVKWYTLSAEQGYPDGQHSLGLMYLLGKVSPKIARLHSSGLHVQQNKDLPVPNTIWVRCMPMEMVSRRIMPVPTCGGLLLHLQITKQLQTI